MITLSEAIARMQSAPMPALKVEKVSLADAFGRISAEDVSSKIRIPTADNSAMDGFAICVSDVPVSMELSVSQRISAGSAAQPLQKGTAARIFTGANIPSGADTVVIQENCDYNNEKVRLLKPPKAGANIRPKGQDIDIGALIIRRGQRINAVDLGLLASIGLADLIVYEKLRVAILSTGDELVDVGQDLKEGEIYNSNRPILMALCQSLGFQVIDYGIVADNMKDTKNALHSASQNAHVTITSGGVSVGEEDYIKAAVSELGQLDLWKVKIKPGKPVAYGAIDGSVFLGLPGNPVSSFIVFHLLGKPLLQTLQGQQAEEVKYYSVKTDFGKDSSTREEFIRVKLDRDPKSGELVARRFKNQSSGVLSSLSWADGLIRQEIGETLSNGKHAQYLPLTQPI